MKRLAFEAFDSLKWRRILRRQNAHRSDEIVVENLALNDKEGEIAINILENRAMSTSFKRDPRLENFTGEKKNQINIQIFLSFTKCFSTIDAPREIEPRQV